MRPTVTAKGYEKLTFQVDNERKDIRLHRAVYEAWHGQIPDGYQINHKDGIKRNNAPSNLEAVTGGENMAHAATTHLMATGKRNGVHTQPHTVRHGERNPQVELSADQVKEIRRKREQGELLETLAAEYKIDQSMVSKIARGKSWVHIK